MPEVVDADYRTSTQMKSKRKPQRLCPGDWLCLRHLKPTKGAKALSREDQARLKVIVDLPSRLFW